MAETPRILGASGEVVSGGAKAITYDDFTVSSNFDKSLGLGQVVLRVPQTTPLTAQDWALVQHLVGKHIDELLEVKKDAGGYLDIVGITQRIEAASKNPPMLIHPNEARMIGLYLITEAEKAISTAISMRILLGLTDPPMPDAEAVRIFTHLTTAVRQSHAAQFEIQQREARQAQRMAEADHVSGSQTGPQ